MKSRAFYSLHNANVFPASAAIDLPLKALAREDESGRFWLGYNDPAYIAKRHGAPDCKVIEPMQAKLSKLAEASVDDSERTDAVTG